MPKKTATVDYADEVQLVHSGDDYFNKLIKLIADAHRELHIQTYIFENDDTGNSIASELIKAAQRGVKIFVLLDSYGSSSFKNKASELLKNNIHFRFFAPLFTYKNIYFGRRLHHKIVVADGAVALIGGINIADKYKGTATEKAWLDYAVLVRGEVCKKLQKICADFYYHNRSKRKSHAHPANSTHKTAIKISQNDWLNYKNEISTAYRRAIGNAKTEIIILGSYFIPGYKFRKALKNAAKRGVKIKILLSGISDVPLIKYATRYMYSFLFKNNIEIYEWPHSVMHGKAAVVDGQWSTVGSYNINWLSAYSSIEMNIEVPDAAFSSQFSAHLHDKLSSSRKISHEQFRMEQTFLDKVKSRLSFFAVRASIVILSAYVNRRGMGD
ncbi:MAG: phospholipase [Saprospiraceae bacterium]|jgi:cardiolipin synthase|nr:phospholipase [Saprospiraceae bacterium]